jgi:hypothetical protein
MRQRRNHRDREWLGDRRDLLRGLGAAGLALVVGPGCTTAGGPGSGSVDRGLPGPDRGLAAADADFVGGDGGLPPIDRAAPAVTRTATFALG